MARTNHRFIVEWSGDEPAFEDWKEIISLIGDGSGVPPRILDRIKSLLESGQVVEVTAKSANGLRLTADISLTSEMHAVLAEIRAIKANS